MHRVIDTESDAPTGDVSDQELVARCQAGDQQAFDTLVLRHQQRALNVAYQLLRNQEDAMEVAQDAFVRAYRSIHDFRGDAAFTTWLHQIVVNLARNKHRWWTRRGREKTMSLDQPLETSNGPVETQIASTAPAPDEQALQREFLGRLDGCMGRLPRKYREVLVLRNVEELSYEEIAVVLRCSVGTVKSRIARARESLRQAMHGDL
jgi:RNA polymerase sigma-70 factor (ECF subfamily)